jgi:hypothetical protein
MNTSYCLLALRRFPLLAGLLIAMASTLVAKAPEPPTLSAYVTTLPGTDMPVIRLEWKPSPVGDPATGYTIYQAKGIGPDGSPGEFVAIGTTANMMFDVEKPERGVSYMFHVTAYNASGESGRSNVVKASVDGQTDPVPGIDFVTKPEYDATVGSLYSYKAEAIDADGGTVRYRMTGSPLGAPIPDAEGMTIDRVTGLVSWTPQRVGTFAAAILAYLESDSTKNAMQVLIINVKAPPCAMIRGTVRDSNGAFIQRGWISAISSDNSNPDGWNTSVSSEVVDGRYELPVSEGTYIIYLKHEYGDIWYGNVHDVADAERVTIGCGDSIQADFSVTIPPPPTYFTVAGRVTGASDGTGVPAIVYFSTRDNAGRTLPTKEGSISPDGMMTKTDPDGNYSIELSDQFSYIAEAIPESDEFLPQYYNGVSSPTEATLITVMTGKKLVNFSLAPRPVYANIITGSVKDTAGTALSSEVIAIRIPDGSSAAEPGKGEFARSVATGDDGSFTLKNLIPGEYVLLAIPNSRDYVPGYYLSGAMAALGWKDATRIRMEETTSTAGNDIILGSRNGVKGFAKLSGYIKVAPEAKRSHTITGYDLLPGVFVYALDPENRVSDYVFSDPSGWFELNELGATDYRIVADKVGYLSHVITTALDYSDNASVEKEMMMTRGASSVDELLTGEGALSVYPNPAGAQLVVRFEAGAGAASLRIIDMFGRTVHATSIDAVDGTNSVVIDISALATGSYRAQIQSGATNRTVPLTIVR